MNFYQKPRIRVSHLTIDVKMIHNVYLHLHYFVSQI
ncbi:unnamed protein product [Trichobilharzia regenti]|nr:unnamed protein product [Trichobilharzia regenti]